VSRYVRGVVLCEDKQHEAFVNRFLKGTGWDTRDLRIVKSPSARGSADQFVRERFPRELRWVRSKGGERVYLIVMIDGDSTGVAGRKTSLSAACEEQGLQPPGDTDSVLICVPTWSIETWLAYLDGATVDETRKDYPKLPRESECAPMVNELIAMCRAHSLRTPTPTSLEDTCISYRRVFQN